jgi:hypothetical protein
MERGSHRINSLSLPRVIFDFLDDGSERQQTI